MLEAILLILGIPILTHVMGPLLIWKTCRLPAIVKFQSIEGDCFKAEKNSEFQRYNRSLVGLGFQTVGSSQLKGHARAYFRLYWNRHLKVAAIVATIKTAIKESTYVELIQLYSDGSALGVVQGIFRFFPESSIFAEC